MARRRYQQGSLKLVGKRCKKWRLRYREDVIRGGQRVRVPRKIILGKLAQYPTKKLALRAAEQKLQQINSITYRPQREGTFAQFAEQWTKDVLSQRKFSTRVTEGSRIKRHILPAFGAWEVRQIGPELVQRFVASAGLHPKTIKNCVATLRMMWNSAKAWGYTSIDWFAGLTLPEWVKPESPHFTLAEMRRIVAAAAGAFQVFCWLAAETGMRLGELCALRVSALRLDAGVIVVRYSSWHGRVGSTKAKRPRKFQLSPQLINKLREHIAPVADDADTFVFRREDGAPWIGDEVVKHQLKPLLNELGIKQGLKRIGAHCFRHGNASVMDSEHIPLKVRQDRLGHMDGEEVTLGIYTHAESADHRAVAEKLGELLAPKLAESATKSVLEVMRPISQRPM